MATGVRWCWNVWSTMISRWGTSKAGIVVFLYSGNNWYCRLWYWILSFPSTILWEDMVLESNRLVCLIKSTKYVKNHICFLSVIFVVTASFPFTSKAYFGKLIQLHYIWYWMLYNAFSCFLENFLPRGLALHSLYMLSALLLLGTFCPSCSSCNHGFYLHPAMSLISLPQQVLDFMPWNILANFWIF